MTLYQAKEFVRSCSKEELSELITVISNIRKRDRAEAKAQFNVGDMVTSDDPRWYYGPGKIVKINRKNIIVNCGGSMVNASVGLLKHYVKS
jgi:hypothetical protein